MAVTGGVRGTAEVDFLVSHAWRDRAWAVWVAWQLKEAGYTVVGSWDWAVGENFIAKMHDALGAANRVAALLASRPSPLVAVSQRAEVVCTVATAPINSPNTPGARRSAGLGR